jgi:hypothetical protein
MIDSLYNTIKNRGYVSNLPTSEIGWGREDDKTKVTKKESEKSTKVSENKWINDIKIAEDLKYPKSVIQALKREPDPTKREGILRKARLK